MDMDGVWEKIKKGLRDGATLSMEKIDEYSKIGKLKVDEMSAKRKIERNFLDIGERFFDLVQDAREKGAADDLVIKKAIDNVRSLNAEIAEIGEKIKEIQKTAAAAAAKRKDAGGADADEDCGV